MRSLLDKGYNRAKRTAGWRFFFFERGEKVRPCYKDDCLSHDRTKALNCGEAGGGAPGGGRCGGYVSAGSLMAAAVPGCRKNDRGRWVAVRAAVYR